MQEAIDKYFTECPDKAKVITMIGEIEVSRPTITGLALFLGFCDRHAMYDYEAKPAFNHTIKNARARMVRIYEQAVQSPSPAGSIFMLKNFGYTDKTEVETYGKGGAPLIPPVKALKDAELDGLLEKIISRREGSHSSAVCGEGAAAAS
jgi:hypothetical protein